MLVQARPHALRLIRQHDHALLSGMIAGAWRAGPRPDGLPPATVLAAGLHDVVWVEEDLHPRLDPHTGLPHDFTTLPADLKGPMVERGLSRLRALEPETAALVAEHHDALREERPAEGEAAWVRLFDALSLFVCLSPPDSDAGARPSWLTPGILRPPGAGAPLGAEWVDVDTLRLEPWPLAGAEVRVAVPYRDLPRRRYDPGELREAWEASAPGAWTVRLTR